jgi:hypothetical protein
MDGITPSMFNTANANLVFRNAVLSSLSSISDDSRYVTIVVGNAVETQTSAKLRIRQNEILNAIETSVTSLFKTTSNHGITVSYTITIILEATKSKTPPLLRTAVSDQLSLVFRNDVFDKKLAAADAGTFGMVNTTALMSVSPASVEVLRTPVPSSAPTTATPTVVRIANASSSNNFSMIYNYFILLLVLVITIVF